MTFVSIPTSGIRIFKWVIVAYCALNFRLISEMVKRWVEGYNSTWLRVPNPIVLITSSSYLLLSFVSSRAVYFFYPIILSKMPTELSKLHEPLNTSKHACFVVYTI
jgi:hypothetical protein